MHMAFHSILSENISLAFTPFFQDNGAKRPIDSHVLRFSLLCVRSKRKKVNRSIIVCRNSKEGAGKANKRPPCSFSAVFCCCGGSMEGMGVISTGRRFPRRIQAYRNRKTAHNHPTMASARPSDHVPAVPGCRVHQHGKPFLPLQDLDDDKGNFKIQHAVHDRT